VFWGFVPRSSKERRERMQQIAHSPWTGVIYESPHRIQELLKDLQEAGAAERMVLIAREVTKMFETFWRGRLIDAVQRAEHGRGEFVLVLGPQLEKAVEKEQASWEDLAQKVAQLAQTGVDPKTAVRRIAADYHVNKRELYAYIHKKQNEK
ncbi:MAG: 16S rRNA (cytidine(1402)-2'-O)-methyltransferase, partial [Firmicutes bacterium]|nr:16S rRNA (cytidine(1402)-2'-O)-methyltransferase [Bacillota bacterium]